MNAMRCQLQFIRSFVPHSAVISSVKTANGKITLYIDQIIAYRHRRADITVKMLSAVAILEGNNS